MLQSVCGAVGKAMRLMSCKVPEHAPIKHKAMLISHLPAGSNLIPMATLVGNNEAPRISIPIAFDRPLPDAAAREQHWIKRSWYEAF
ncbi:hypothetical protein [Mycetohabitans sp. B46]|uniref:hypothetical protein n=1 Tax=Mycetohabitans sp. B46 TaxID=2772536 RepID=UPI00307CEDA6